MCSDYILKWFFFLNCAVVAIDAILYHQRTLKLDIPYLFPLHVFLNVSVLKIFSGRVLNNINICGDNQTCHKKYYRNKTFIHKEI
jgi:hypothetical protein